MQENQNENTSSPLLDEEEIDLLEIFGTIWKYKVFIIIFTFIAALGAVTFSLLSIKLPPEKNPLPNVYKPSALILINEQQSGGLSSAISSSGLGGLASLAGVSAGQSYGDLAVKLISSKSIVDIIINEFNITQRYKITNHPIGNSRKTVNEHLSAKYDDSTGTVTITYEDYDPEFAKNVVNRVVELLEKRFASIGGNRNLTQKNLLEKKLVEVKAEITRLEKQIQAFQQKYGTLDIKTLAQEQVTMLAEVRSKLILKEMEIKTYSDFSTINDPVVKRMKTEKDNLSDLLNQMEQGFTEYQKVYPPQQELPKLAFDFERMQRELEVQAKIYEILTQQYELTKLSVEGDEPIFQVLELAETPDLKSGPRRSIICIGATLGGFFLSIIIVFIRNAVRNIKNDPERMKKFKGIQ